MKVRGATIGREAAQEEYEEVAILHCGRTGSMLAVWQSP
jgi:hypothetical protein